jgi:glycosyltransferase involved in cell wall biosynthesis
VNAPGPVKAATASCERPLRVLQVIDSFGVGGAETWLIELMRHWRGCGAPVQTDVLATSGGEGVFDAEARDLGARIFYLRYGRGDLPSFRSGFRRILREGGYDALHDHQDHASGWHYLIGAGLLPPVRVTHVHNPAYQLRNNYGVTLRRRLTSRAGRRLVARYATHIVGTSRAAIDASGYDDRLFAALPKAAIYCGFDPARFLSGVGDRAAVRAEFGWPADGPMILFAGRFDISPDVGHPQNHKNSGFGVEVAIACAAVDPTVRFVFAGPFSAATPELQRRIEAAGVAGQVVFAGVRQDIGRLMGAADVLFFPSRAEGLGMVAVEAQAAGLAVLASSEVPRECVVVPELVTFLELDVGVSAWRDQLLGLTRRPRLESVLANRRVAASPFAIDQSARRLVQLYRDGVLA